MIAFKTYLSTEAGLAENTITAYVSDLHLFESFLAQQTGSFDLYTFDDLHVSAFIRSSMDRISTIRRRVASIRVWLRFQQMHGRKVESILARIDRPRAERNIPHVLGRQAVLKLISAASDARGSAALELLYASGLRASELCNLSKADINFADRSVRVFGKGNKERIVPFGIPAARAIWSYLASRKDNCKFAFEHNGQQLGRRELQRIVRAAWIKSGIAQHVSPHTLRHCFASHLLSGHDAVEIEPTGTVTINLENGGANIRVVQELMGHNSVNTTQVYTHVDLGRLKKIHALLGR